MKRLLFVFLISVLCTSFSNAQFSPNKHHLGPSVGFSFLGSTPQFGLNYEYGMDVKDFGLIGIGGIARYWSYSEGAGSWGWKYTDILIGVQANYHFKISDGKFDPWLGVTLAYDAGSVSWDGPSGQSFATPTYGGMFFGGNAGARYWFSPAIAVAARLGFGSLGYGGLDLGVDFKF
ncbi:MAG: hypothetical protein RBR74_07885 [Ignavibacteriaceae bacterium]|jgi:hypothetical protein|nr:hypothetical protein [Ignavibacteriaceae bacterium]